MQVDPTIPIIRWNEGVKRSRSTSPSSNKRRVPANCVPTIYSHFPQHLVRGFSHSNSSSPVESWVTRTEGLVLVTPDSGSPPVFDSSYIEASDNEMMSQEMEVLDLVDLQLYQQSSSLHPFHPLQSNPIQASPVYNHQTSNTTLNSHPSPLSSRVAPPPHHLPSLYSNLAGSPTSSPLSRSHNSSSEDHNVNATFLGERSLMDTEMTSSDPESMTEQLNYSASSFLQDYGMGTGGRKPRISMGYRADCLKCIARVPGHYSHLV